MNLSEMILNIFNDKRQRNSAYSLRALARDLKIDVGQLNRIVNAKSKPSVVVAFRVGRYLELKDEHLVSLIERTIENNP